MTDTEVLNQVRQYWLLIRGAQMDMLNGCSAMAAMEEIAIASRGMDELLSVTATGPTARGTYE